jgi:glycosyltransferase involved in cell wall biosynthesis
MHVTLVTSAFQNPDRSDAPGVGRYTTELARALSDRGVAVRVVVPDTKASCAPEGSVGNVEVVRVTSLANSIGRIGNVGQANLLSFGSSFARMPRLLDDTDVVHSTIPLLGVDSIRRHCPVVAFSHHVEQIRSPRDLLAVPFANAYGSYMYQRADAVVAPSRATGDRLVRRFSVKPARVKVIHHGISTQIFFRETRGAFSLWKEAMQTILYVGPLSARKNVLFLLDAFRHLGASLRDAQLVLIGSGPLETQVQRMTDAPPFEGRVVRLRQLSDDQLRQAYGAADVFVSASLDEGFGFAAVEAMACGTPVIALDTVVNREIVGDGGLLVSGATSVELSDAIRKVLRDPRLSKELSERGSRRVEERYSWAVAADAYVKLYEGLQGLRAG